MTKWHHRFLDMAKMVAGWSKDPSTKTGAVIVDTDRRVLAVGYNGFPRNFPDDPALYADREFKYEHIVHCEINALLNCEHRPKGATLYTWPFGSCSNCAKTMSQSGIKLAVYPTIPDSLKERWQASVDKAKDTYNRSGIETLELEMSHD